MIRLGVIGGFLFSALATAPAWATTCDEPSIRERYRQTTYVFEGIAERLEKREDYREYFSPLARSDSSFGGREPITYQTVFRVTKAIKGRPVESRTVIHAMGLSSDRSFEIGAKYRVFAHKVGDALYSTFCDGSHVLGESEQGRQWAESEEAYLAKASEEERIRHKVWQELDKRQVREAEGFAKNYHRRTRDISHLRGGSEDLPSFERLRRTIGFLKHYGDWENLEDAYKILGLVAPKGEYATLGQAFALGKQGKFEESIALYEEGLLGDHHNAEARRELARVRLQHDGTLSPFEKEYRGISVQELDISDQHGAKADFNELQTGRIIAKHANLAGARFTHARIEEGAFDKANLSNARFHGAMVRNASFQGSNLANTDLSFGRFRRIEFAGADLTHADATGAYFASVNLRDAKLDRVRFHKARMRRLNARDVDFSNSDLTEAVLDGANLEGADLSKVVAKGLSLRGVRVNCETKLPFETETDKTQMIPVPVSCGGIAQNRDFSNKEWPFFDASGASFDGADFTGVKFDNVNFEGTSLRQAVFRGSMGASRFGGADLTGASFVDAKKIGGLVSAPSPAERNQKPRIAILDKTDFTGATFVSHAFYVIHEGAVHAPDLSTTVFEGAKISCTHRYRPKPEEAESEAVKEYRRERLRYFNAERNLVRMLRDKWPSMTFERCDIHFEEAGE